MATCVSYGKKINSLNVDLKACMELGKYHEGTRIREHLDSLNRQLLEVGAQFDTNWFFSRTVLGADGNGAEHDRV